MFSYFAHRDDDEDKKRPSLHDFAKKDEGGSKMASPMNQTLGGKLSQGIESENAFEKERKLQEDFECIEAAYLQAIEKAQREIILANAYFLPGLNFRHALVAAARRGVRLVLLGRSPAPVAEPDWLSVLENEADIKMSLLENEFRERAATPVEVDRPGEAALMQEVVRLVDEDPVRQARASSQGGHALQQLADERQRNQ